MKKKFTRSRFNYVSKNKKGYVIYNTLYNSLTRLSEEEYDIYLSEEYDNSAVAEQLCIQGLWVDEGVDELEQYNLYVDYSNRYIGSKPHLTITPTMECNANCFYCYEDGVRCGRMQQEECEKIICFLQTLDCSQGIDLTWFGGEPLMNQEWMDCFADCLEKAGIDFSAFMITNGSKINDTIIDKMINKWKIQDVQITLDGCYEEYYVRKKYVDQDTAVYYKILQAVEKLGAKGIRIQLRLNVDRYNRKSILNVVHDIKELFKDNNKVVCYPAFISGVKEPLTEKEKIEFLKEMMEISQGKFNVNEYLYKLPRTKACYYYQKNAFSIDVNGNVFICEQMLGREQQAIGNIKTGISAVERERSGNRKECQECVFLPKCQGGCINSWQNGETPCFTDKYIIMAYLDLL